MLKNLKKILHLAIGVFVLLFVVNAIMTGQFGHRIARSTYRDENPIEFWLWTGFAASLGIFMIFEAIKSFFDDNRS